MVMTKDSILSYFIKLISDKLGNDSGDPVALEGVRRVKLPVQIDCEFGEAGCV